MYTAKSRPVLKTLILYIVGFLFMAVGGYLLLVRSTEGPYIDIPSFIMALVLCNAALGTLYILPFKGQVVIRNEKIILNRLFGLIRYSFPFDTITHYNEEFRSSKSEHWTEFTYYSSRGKIKFDTRIIKNYSEFTYLFEDMDANPGQLRRNAIRTMKAIGFFFTFAGLLISFGLWYESYGPFELIAADDITRIEGTISNQLRLINNSDNKHLRIELEEYPTFIFSLGRTAVKTGRLGYMEKDLQRGDRVTLGIKTDSYEKKITKSKTLSFWDKFSHYNTISSFTASSGTEQYLSLKQYNIEKSRHRNSFATPFFIAFTILIMLLGLFILLFGERYLKKESS